MVIQLDELRRWKQDAEVKLREASKAPSNLASTSSAPPEDLNAASRKLEEVQQTARAAAEADRAMIEKLTRELAEAKSQHAKVSGQLAALQEVSSAAQKPVADGGLFTAAAHTPPPPSVAAPAESQRQPPAKGTDNPVGTGSKSQLDDEENEEDRKRRRRRRACFALIMFALFAAVVTVVVVVPVCLVKGVCPPKSTTSVSPG